MSTGQITTSAVLFYEAEHQRAVTTAWFEKASRLFGEYRLSPVLFTAGGGEFALDDTYVLADSGGDLVKWGELLPAGRDRLIAALRSGAIYDLGLDSPRANAPDRSDWRADVSTGNGEFYMGIDEELVSDPVALLRKAYEIARDLFEVRYGFAYKMALADEPDCYASGPSKRPLSEVFEMIRHRREWDRRKKTADELWAEELYGKRRHLTGLFRGAYPANVLSESHVERAGLKSEGIGRLTKLNTSLSLWELSDAEVPKAAEMLAGKNLLVSQADER